MATNLLNVTNGLVATWTFKCSHVPIGPSRLPSYKMTISFMERVALVIFNNPDLPVFSLKRPRGFPHLSDAEEDGSFNFLCVSLDVFAWRLSKQCTASHNGGDHYSELPC